MSLAEELAMLRKRVRIKINEIRRLKEEMNFSRSKCFFAASRRKSARTKE